MKPKGKKRGFTIIELLTVMSIIVLLIGILVPAMNAIRRYSRVVVQKSQFHDISRGLETFSADYDGYPDSSAEDLDGDDFCGAMKLCEAMVGQDGLGFHPDSIFDDEGDDADNQALYFNRSPLAPYNESNPVHVANLRARKPLYIEGEQVQIESIETVLGNEGNFDANCPVLCDAFKRGDLRNTAGEKLGMPILYYKADPSKYTHDPNEDVVNAGTNIYNCFDNHQLLVIEVPWLPGTLHPMCGGTGANVIDTVFYEKTRDRSVKVLGKPHNPNTFILISAGWDGLYGTEDDVYNFEEK